MLHPSYLIFTPQQSILALRDAAPLLKVCVNVYFYSISSQYTLMELSSLVGSLSWIYLVWALLLAHRNRWFHIIWALTFVLLPILYKATLDTGLIRSVLFSLLLFADGCILLLLSPLPQALRSTFALKRQVPRSGNIEAILPANKQAVSVE
jgi:hypothetical protein